MAKPRRRQAGEGSISEYATKAGRRFLIKYSAQREDGTRRIILKRGFRTRKEAAAALRAEIRKSELGEWVEPSKQRLDAYLAEWVQGQRLSPATLASYRKNIRLHIDPYLGAQPVAPHRRDGGRLDAEAGGIRAGRRSGRPFRADGALRLHDPAVGPGRCGQAGAAVRRLTPVTGPRHGLAAAGSHPDAPR